MPTVISRRAIVGLGALVAVAVGAILAVPPTRAGTAHDVQIVGFAFAPAELTIAVGDTVTWTNADAVVHTATATGGTFDSGSLDQGESFSFTFTAPGTYDYVCTPHPFMTGRIVVQAAGGTPAPTATPTATPAAPGPIVPVPNVAVPAPRLPLVAIVGAVFVIGATLAAEVRLRRR